MTPIKWLFAWVATWLGLAAFSEYGPTRSLANVLAVTIAFTAVVAQLPKVIKTIEGSIR